MSHSFTKGSTTFFAGPQVGVKLPAAGPFSGAGATARGGVYVTFDVKGQFQDVGIRGTTSVSASVNPVTASYSGPDGSFSLVGIFSSPSS